MFKGYLYIILSAVIYGCMPMAAKFIYADGVSSLCLGFLRNLLAVPILALLAVKSGQPLRIDKKAFKILIVVGLFSGCFTPLLLFSSYSYLPAGTATVFHYVYPAVVVIGSLLLRVALLGVALCTCGIAFFFEPGSAVDLRGALLAIVSGISYAVYILLLSRFRYREITGFRFSFYVSAVSSIPLGLLCAFTGQLILPSNGKIWLLCILFALMVAGVASILFQLGVSAVGSQISCILSTAEPLTSVILGILFFQEKFSLRIAFGVIIVLVASAMVSIHNENVKKKAAETACTEVP